MQGVEFGDQQPKADQQRDLPKCSKLGGAVWSRLDRPCGRDSGSVQGKLHSGRTRNPGGILLGTSHERSQGFYYFHQAYLGRIRNNTVAPPHFALALLAEEVALETIRLLHLVSM